MTHNPLKWFLVPLFFACFSPAVFCSEIIASEVFLDGKPMSDANRIVLFAKQKKVTVINRGEDAAGRNFDLFGSMSFDAARKPFDEMLKKKTVFTVVFMTATSSGEEKVTFIGCRMNGKDKGKKEVTYTFKAADLR